MVTLYGIKVMGPLSDEWTGWAVRNEIGENGTVLVNTVKSLRNAEKDHTVEEAFETAFTLVTQQPHLLGRVRVMKLRPAERDGRWMVEAECTP